MLKNSFNMNTWNFKSEFAKQLIHNYEENYEQILNNHNEISTASTHQHYNQQSSVIKENMAKTDNRNGLNCLSEENQSFFNWNIEQNNKKCTIYRALLDEVSIFLDYVQSSHFDNLENNADANSLRNENLKNVLAESLRLSEKIKNMLHVSDHKSIKELDNIKSIDINKKDSDFLLNTESCSSNFHIPKSRYQSLPNKLRSRKTVFQGRSNDILWV